MPNNKPLPRGIWHEKSKRRYRVRKYRNKVSYLVGYFKTEPDARAALKRLNTKLAAIPKNKRGEAPPTPVHPSTFLGATQNAKEKSGQNPHAFKIRK